MGGLEDAKQQLRNYTSQMDRPFSLKWNRETKSFDVDRNIVRHEKKAAQLVYTYSEDAPEDNKGVNPELLETQEAPVNGEGTVKCMQEKDPPAVNGEGTVACMHEKDQP